MVKQLSREEIKRLFRGQGSNTGSGGAASGGGITQAQLDAALAKKVDVDFFAKLFEVYDGEGSSATKIETNGTMPTSTDSVNIKALFGFWTEKFVSALGLNSGGGGGGGASVLTDLLDVNSSMVPTTNQVLTYINGKWTSANAQTSGGTVTSVGMTVPTGLSVSPASITSSGTFAITFATGYSIPTTAKQANWDTAYSNNHTHSNKSTLDNISSAKVSNWDTAYGWGNHANAGYLLASTFNNTTWWGQSVSNGVVDGSMTGVGNISMSGYISYSGASGLRFYYQGTERLSLGTTGQLHIKNGSVGLRIGDALLYWDSSSNALKLTTYNGGTAHFVATGGVTALG